MRTYILFVFLGAAACAAGEGDGGGAGGGDGATGNGTTASAGPSGSTVTGAPASCVSDTPCASDLQCTTLLGHACNTELSPPMCQRLTCEGEIACDGRDAFCTPDRICRVVDHAEGLTCLPETVTTEECLASCQSAPLDDDEGCTQDPHTLCAALCAKPDLCQGKEGFSYVRSIWYCHGGATFDLWCKGGTNDAYDVYAMPHGG